MKTVGIDIGSLSTKSAMIDDERGVLAYDVVLTGGDNRNSAEKTFQNLLNKTGLKKDDIDFVLTTGYGRENVPFSNANVTEITCHAKGMHYLNPSVRTLLDIGGQDSKAIQIDEDGNVVDFLMNDKCAAGSGRFLEIIARALSVDLKDLGRLSLEADEIAKISNMCSVFAETEVVSLVAIGTPVPSIVKGVHTAIVERSISMMKTVGLIEPIGMSGGVALNKGIVQCLRENLKMDVNITDYSQVVGAIGAASIGMQKCKKNKSLEVVSNVI